MGVSEGERKEGGREGEEGRTRQMYTYKPIPKPTDPLELLKLKLLLVHGK